MLLDRLLMLYRGRALRISTRPSWGYMLEVKSMMCIPMGDGHATIQFVFEYLLNSICS